MYSFEQRKDALQDMVANLRRPSRDPVAKMRKLERKHGGLASLYHCAAYETQSPLDCLAAHEARADEWASQQEDWQTLDAIRQSSFERLRADINSFEPETER